MRIKRREMKPGTVFVQTVLTAYGPWRSRRDYVLVVLDEKREVDFWRGGYTAYGDIAPGSYFEVL